MLVPGAPACEHSPDPGHRNSIEPEKRKKALSVLDLLSIVACVGRGRTCWSGDIPEHCFLRIVWKRQGDEMSDDAKFILGFG
jgi:hypothetical protein